MKNKTYKTTET